MSNIVSTNLLFSILWNNYKKIVSTDGDTGYNKKSYETFYKYISFFEKDGVLTTIENIINTDDVYWISDFLHIFKLARKRLI